LVRGEYAAKNYMKVTLGRTRVTKEARDGQICFPQKSPQHG